MESIIIKSKFNVFATILTSEMCHTAETVVSCFYAAAQQHGWLISFPAQLLRFLFRICWEPVSSLYYVFGIVLIVCFVASGYGFVDFDSPGAAQKAVAALKAAGVQAQMAKVRIPYRLILISQPYKSFSHILCPPSASLMNLKLILEVLNSRLAGYLLHSHWSLVCSVSLWSLSWVVQEMCADSSVCLCNYCMSDKCSPCTSLLQLTDEL